MGERLPGEEIEGWRRAVLELLARIREEDLQRAAGLAAYKQMLDLLVRVMVSSRRVR